MLFDSKNRNAFVSRKILPSLAALLFVVSGLLNPAIVRAVPVEDVGPGAAAEVKGEVGDSIGSLIATAAVSAVINTANYFATQIAYSAAVALTTDCGGQAVCWDSKAFSSGFKDAWQGAIGEAVGSLSEGLLGDRSLCNPGPFKLRIALGKLNELKPPPPKCSFDTLKSSWSTLATSLTPGELGKMLRSSFEPGQTEQAIALDMIDFLNEEEQNAKREQIIKQLKASGGGGFEAVSDVVSGRIKAPAAYVQEELSTQKKNMGESQKDTTESSNAGAIAAKAAGMVAINAASTFTQTIVSRLWNRLVDGLLSTEELIAKQPNLVLDFEAVLNPGKAEIREAIQTRFVSTSTRDVGEFDPLLEYISCPGSNPGPNHCVMDGQFANAVRLGDTLGITVKEALKNGMLHKEWPLFPATFPEKDRDNFCYTYAYCESNLKKLRASRILPIGWEIAASKSSPGTPVTLGEVVSRFDDCNDGGEADGNHPWCHLIDPNWVLKVPPTQCRAMAYGPSLLIPSAPIRGEVCVDAPTCLRQDDFGACTGGWGYCTRERNVWRFNGDQCPAHYASCRSLTTRTGDTVNYLTNTLTYGVCNADNVGCLAYHTESDPDQDPASATDNWDIDGDKIYFNRNVTTCDANVAGCSAVVPLAKAGSVNLIRNGSFEELVDGDGDGTPDHAKHWSPFAAAPTSGNSVSAGMVNQRGEFSTTGSNAVGVNRRAKTSSSGDIESENPITWSDDCGSSSGSVEGSICTYNGSRNNLDGYTCRIAPGESKCLVTQRVTQVNIPVPQSRTHTLSASFSWKGQTQPQEAFMLFTPHNSSGNPRNFSSSDVSRLPATMTGGTLSNGFTDNCVVVPGSGNVPDRIQVSFSGAVLNPGSKSVRVSCTFLLRNFDARGSVEFGSWTGNSSSPFTAETNAVFVDDVVLTEGTDSTYRDGYGTTTPPMEYLKVAPSNLNCTGEETDRAECANYAGICRASELGCTRYSPNNGDAAIPAITGPQDSCPAECVGYDTYKQEQTEFEAAKFPAYFIPSTAKQCTEADSGCSQFTNVETEEVSYFSKLRICEDPSSDPQTVFYSWEGSDTTGYQLKVWNFKKTAGEVVSSANPLSDIPAVVGSTTAGYAPCTKLDTDGRTCISPPTSGNNTGGLCTAAEAAGGDFDCREFYDTDGNRHFRKLSKTIILSADCHDYRITTSTEDECDSANGRWTAQGQCIYAADPGQSAVCTAAVNGCRPYKGNASGNERAIYVGEFENGPDGWEKRVVSNSSGNFSDVATSPEAIVVGGHSAVIPDGYVTRKTISGIKLNRSYSVSYWARGSGTLRVFMSDNSESLNFEPTVNLTSDWKRFTAGPIIATTQGWGGQVTLRFENTGTTTAYLDNVTLREVQDSIYVVRGSWKTPISCDRTQDGLPSPQEMLGCRAYGSSKGGSVNLRSFSQLCRDKAVGCSAYSDMKTTLDTPHAKTWNAVCDMGSTCDDGNCTCNFDTGHPLERESSTSKNDFSEVLLRDVCRVKKGESTCRFNLDEQLYSSAINDDTVAITTDRQLFLVPGGSNSCEAANVGCQEVGVPVYGLNGSGNKVLTGWTNTVVKKDPAKFSNTLCLKEAIQCEEYKGTEGNLYFKSPEPKTCIFKEDAKVDDKSVSGWFRNVKGADLPCDPDLLKNGEFYQIPKNADSSYAGYVGICEPEFDRCEEFVDPADTTATNPDGHPYYYLMNNRLDMKSCEGQVSLEEGCVMFRRAGDPSRRFASYSTYYESEQRVDGGRVSPINCNNVASNDPKCDNRCQNSETGEWLHTACSNGNTGDKECKQLISKGECENATSAVHGNDANIIIKVRKDRECAEWLQCSAFEAALDSATGKFKNTCVSVDLCSESRKVGDTQDCGRWASYPSDPEILTADKYVNRNVTYNGLEYSGYSLVNKYPVQYYGLAKNEGNLGARRYGVVKSPGNECKRNSDCSGGGACYAGECYYGFGGQGIDVGTENIGACRGYPEEDSPFDGYIVKAYKEPPEIHELLVGFSGANYCNVEGESCDCSYNRFGYGQNGSIEKFHEGGSDKVIDGICISGPKEGEACTNNAGCKVGDESGICALKTKKLEVLGWEGLCVDSDKSYIVGANPNQFACNLWYPVDRILGATDMNAQYKDAGFLPSKLSDNKEELLYCGVAKGNVSGEDYKVTVLDGEFDKHNNGEEQEQENFEVTSPYLKHETSYIKVQLFGGHDGGNYASASTDIYLFPDNDWQVAFDYSTACKSGGERVACPGVIYNKTDNGVSADWCDKYATKGSDFPGGDDDSADGAELCVRAWWKSNGTLESINISSSNEDVGGDDDPTYLIKAIVYGREVCQDIIKATKGDNPAIAWTDRLLRENGKRTGGAYDFGHTSDFTEDSTETAQNPYGRIVQKWNWDADNIVFEVDQPDFVEDSGGGAWSWPLQVWSSEGGSPYAQAYVQCDGDLVGLSSCRCEGEHQNWPNLVQCEFKTDGGGAISGIPFSFDGKSELTDAGFDDSWDSDGDNALVNAYDRISELFVKVYDTYGWDGGGTYKDGNTTDPSKTDFREDFTARPPKVFGVKTSACSGPLGCVPWGPSTISVNGFVDETLQGDGKLKVTIQYYAQADKDHMPLRLRVVNFGDGMANDASGFYRNHIGCPADSSGFCKESGCDESVWGTTRESCETGYFSVTKTYTCDSTKVGRWPACSSSGYPCVRDGNCVFQPRVRVVDNWGQCNGTCPGGPGPGNSCMNSSLDPIGNNTAQTNGNFDDECKVPYDQEDSQTWEAWTPYLGEIIVKPIDN